LQFQVRAKTFCPNVVKARHWCGQLLRWLC
jgi:hypothetical protein